MPFLTVGEELGRGGETESCLWAWEGEMPVRCGEGRGVESLELGKMSGLEIKMWMIRAGMAFKANDRVTGSML